MEIQLTPENIQFPVLFFLDKNIEKEYNEAVKEFNSKQARDNLKIYPFKNGAMQGSNVLKRN